MANNKKLDMSQVKWKTETEKRRERLLQRTTKWCVHCQSERPLEEFYFVDAYDGVPHFSAWCKYHARWYQREYDRQQRAGIRNPKVKWQS